MERSLKNRSHSSSPILNNHPERLWKPVDRSWRGRYKTYLFDRKLRKAGIESGWRIITSQIWDKFLGQYDYTPLKFKEELLENIKFEKAPILRMTFAPLVMEPEEKLVKKYSQRDCMLCSIDVEGDFSQDSHLISTLEVFFDPQKENFKPFAQLNQLMVFREYWNLIPSSSEVEKELALQFFKQYTRNIEHMFKIWNISEIAVREHPTSVLVDPYFFEKYGYSQGSDQKWYKILSSKS